MARAEGCSASKQTAREEKGDEEEAKVIAIAKAKKRTREASAPRDFASNLAITHRASGQPTALLSSGANGRQLESSRSRRASRAGERAALAADTIINSVDSA